MRTLLRIGWTNLKRDRVAQALTFLLPIIFFSIFAIGLRRPGRVGRPPRIRVAVVDEDRLRVQPADDRRRCAKEPACASGPTTTAKPARAVWIAPAAERLVQERRRAGRGRASRAVSAQRSPSTGFGGGAVDLQLLADPSDPIAPNMVAGPAAEGRDDGGARSDDAGRHAAVRDATPAR